VPLLGPAPGWAGLTLAVGFSGHGFAIAPAVGAAIAAQLSGEQAPALAGLDPSRMAAFDPAAVAEFRNFVI
jgi:sarcosine oxidase subunit beta